VANVCDNVCQMQWRYRTGQGGNFIVNFSLFEKFFLKIWWEFMDEFGILYTHLSSVGNYLQLSLENCCFLPSLLNWLWLAKKHQICLFLIGTVEDDRKPDVKPELYLLVQYILHMTYRPAGIACICCSIKTMRLFFMRPSSVCRITLLARLCVHLPNSGFLKTKTAWTFRRAGITVCQY